MDEISRDELLRRLVGAVESRTLTHPTRVAIDGAPAAGKTTLADELATALRTRGRDVIRATIDDFLRPWAQRYARGEFPAEARYFDAHDHKTLNRVLLDPLGPEGGHRPIPFPRQPSYIHGMTPDDSIEVAEDGMARGEMPIGAVVEMGGTIIARSFTQDTAQARRLVHADLLAMIAADKLLSWRKRPHPLRLAVNLEPCLMCMGGSHPLHGRPEAGQVDH